MNSGDAMLISRATSDDVAAVAPLFDSYRAFFSGGSNLEQSRRFLEQRLASGESVLFVARENGNAVGFIQLYPLWSSWHCRRIWFLSDLYVGETSRKHGVGRQLVERVIEYAHETNAASIMVELPRREPHLTEFYRRLGFIRDEVFELARYSCEPSA
jgi:ribosomal protein S18 acetylase RimI-like enzyme